MAPRPVDDHHYTYYDPGSNNDDQEEKRELIEIKEKCQTLEKRVKSEKRNNIFGTTVIDMCLVSDLVIPSKFETPNFEKYNGNTCPRSHLVMYF